MKYIIGRIVVSVITVVLAVVGVFKGLTPDNAFTYKKEIAAIPVYSNDIKTALPQTDVYTIINEHFAAPLKEGTKIKKAIVIGYDGCQAGLLKYTDEAPEGGISYLLSTGGDAKLSYSGGANYPYMTTQQTSTGSSWCSMLTGKWGTETGVDNNGVNKPNDYLTNLTSLVQDGTINSSAFYVSSDCHFIEPDSTYILEKQYVEENGINTHFVDSANDDETFDNIINDLKKQNCSDYIFSTFEYTDHEGHTTGFSINNEKYKEAYITSEEVAREIIDTVEARETYSEEDWLIMITTDHGGVNNSHGSMTVFERMTFIVTR